MYILKIANDAVIGLQNWAASDWFIHRSHPQSADGVISARLLECLWMNQRVKSVFMTTSAWATVYVVEQGVAFHMK